MENTKSFIAVRGNEYFEGEKYIPELYEEMGVMSFEREKALLMTETEVIELCKNYPELKPQKI